MTVSEIAVLVATPHLPENVTPASEIDVQIDQAYLGSCTNGRIEDMRAAAAALKGMRREILLPVILFPVLFPLIMVLVTATANVLTYTSAIPEIRLLCVYDIVFFLISLIAFEYAIE